ncbi:glyoxylate reductase [Penicillium chermesinum]|uniref:Glyoxylate reductase n=1 Tax=Penicillium chermesinum TaxID=63820 RepID=A0A9W9NCE5_9EURO|nr:glyoxylate reductase [Penicillium chermesinum]KAJ5217287.1 glyoxylate reductase [Penicillium chermesinum]
MSSQPKILLLGSVDLAKEAWNALSSLGEVIQPTSTNRADFLQECRDGKLDGVVAAYRTFHSTSVTGLIDQEVVDVLPSSLKFIAHCGAGYDQIDVHACKARDPPIRVSNVPTAVNDATADVNMFLILGALRNFNTGMHALREGKWRGQPPATLGHDPEGKVLGILGMGGIGRNLKKKAEAFGMKVIYHNRMATDQAKKHTYHIIGAAEFAKMKDGVVVVNTARGAVMDEAALVEALDSGKVFSAGLDVFEEEPKVHPGLLRNQNVMLVPHMGTWTIETMTAMEAWAIENVRLALETGKLKSIVPEQSDLHPATATPTMAEYWKSAPRFWCKQCKIFIRDTPFEKTQHEASPKHQGNLKRFLRDIHRNNENKERETQRAKSEVERLRQAVAGESSTPGPYRADLALAGNWQTVSETKIMEPDEVATKSIGVRKRKLNEEEVDEEGEPLEQYEHKGWGSRMRSHPVGRQDDDDLDALLASTTNLKKTKNPKTGMGNEEAPKPEVLPKSEEAPEPTPEAASTIAIKTEEGVDTALPTNETPASESAPGVVFKKRKPKVMRK